MWNENAQSLDAHCTNPKHVKCAINRTITASRSKPQQGRPLGFLVGWLVLAQVAARCEDRKSHFDMRMCKARELNKPSCKFADIK